MRLRHIEVFFAIWRTGSVTGAAEELAVSQSSISKTLKHAEQGLGFPLFHRVRGKMITSEEGEFLLSDAARIHESLESIRRGVAGLRSGVNRTIRIACLPSLGQWLVPLGVVAFHKKYPQISLEIATKHEGELLEGVRSREFDIAFTFGPPANHPALPGLMTTRIDEGQLVLLSPGKGGWAAPIALDDIDYSNLIGLSERHFLGGALHRELTARRLLARPCLMVQTYSVARALIANGVGCCLVDEFTAITQPINAQIRLLQPEMKFGVYTHLREGRTRSLHESALVEAIQACARRARRHYGVLANGR